MRKHDTNDDDTVVIRRAPIRQKKSRLPLAIGGAFAVVLLAAGGAWFVFGQPALIPIDTETEAQIDGAQPCNIQVSRFASDPDIVVIDFPNLITQGFTLDRVAALVEKANLPRDRVLDDAELQEAITNCGDTIETYYYGHDYQAADLAKFFRLAAQDHIRLNPQELWLKRLVEQLGWLKPGANGAIITLPATGGPVTPDMRAVILHHELSHGAFYTDAVYRQYAVAFWYGLTQADRAAFTGFLGRQGYDTTDTTLMLNETQAYLIFTRDPRFFNAAAVGMTQAEIDQLRAGFIANMPKFWLQPMANATLPVSAAPAACPVA
jgi:hypothetical protein